MGDCGPNAKRKLKNCKFHAFDISPDGPEILAKFAKDLETSNHLEMSVQNAEEMRFGDSTFDVIIGSSVLHHFDNYESFLTDCHRMLKPGAVAIFGEPFALGYGIAAAVLLIAQRQLGTHYEGIELIYDDMAFRNKNSRALLNGLVDKHLFYTQALTHLAQQIGFSSVNFISPDTGEYIRDCLINELLRERGIKDDRLADYATNIYRIVFNVFGPDNVENSMGPFMNIVFKR